MAAAIEVVGMSKRYRLGARVQGSLREALKLGGRRPADEELWALRDIDLEISPGEVVGIIGRNGAGKSTLLKILSRITPPTSGVVRMTGRVGALLEVGTGFHSELTGRENVYLNGTIIGMSRREIRRRFDAIVEFSGVERFLDTPIKRYSSGMQLRLAFAVAAHLEPETMIVDEVLAVGDAAFQRRCIGRMGELAKEGRTVVFVSHDTGAIARLCTRAVWLRDGRLHLDGSVPDVVDAYWRSLEASANERDGWRVVAGAISVDAVRVGEAGSGKRDSLPRGAPLTFTARITVQHDLSGVDAAFSVADRSGNRLVEDALSDHGALMSFDEGSHELTMTIPGVLPVGDYSLGLWLYTAGQPEINETVQTFEIRPAVADTTKSIARRRLVQPEATWQIDRAPG